MKKTVILAVLIAAGCPFAAFSFDKSITCEPPQGTRIDYFLKNPTNAPNDSFSIGKDRVSSAYPKMTFYSDEVLFKVGNSAQGDVSTVTSVMKILEQNDEQITFSGMLNDAPIMATYYPQMKILIYSQQSIWPSPDYQGARALLMYAKCTEDDVQAAPSQPQLDAQSQG